MTRFEDLSGIAQSGQLASPPPAGDRQVGSGAIELAGQGSDLLCVVLEDYFHGRPLSRLVSEDRWSRFEARIEKNTLRTLDLLDELGAKATFFTLGWVAQELPDLVAEVARRGHEVASKGFGHRAISDYDPKSFLQDALRAREAIETAAGSPVRGYRIARGAISERDAWAWEVLAEAGYQYDTSFRPIGRACRDHPERRFIHRRETAHGPLWQVPVSSWHGIGFDLPFAGGNFLRQFPEAFLRDALQKWRRNSGNPLVAYFHVWELDPEIPKLSGIGQVQELRLYRNLDRMPERLHWILAGRPIVSIDRHLPLAARTPVAVRTQQQQSNHSRKAAANAEAVSVVVPCYNEEPSLGYLANTLTGLVERFSDSYDLSFVFVDDGSSDGTWEKLHELFGNWPNARLVRHAENSGVAAATMTGIVEAQTEIVCAMDSDCTYDPMQFRRMLEMLGPDVDLVTASPYHREGEARNVPPWRLFLSRGLSLLYSLVLEHQFATYTSCFRVYRRSAVKDLELRYGGFLGIAEILARLDFAGHKIVECPAVLESRILGQSKMKVVRGIAGHLRLLTQLSGLRLVGEGAAEVPGNLQRSKR